MQCPESKSIVSLAWNNSENVVITRAHILRAHIHVPIYYVVSGKMPPFCPVWCPASNLVVLLAANVGDDTKVMVDFITEYSSLFVKIWSK